tara:strand:+ start:388 stop:1581 length:1194 start_codon:yes stop_codon:yes gene_type:complete
MALKDFMVKQNAQMMGHNIIGGYLGGPATFVIDPATIGDNTGTVQIKGNLQVDGTNTTINSATLTVDDKNIVIASGAANAAAADGAGITVDGASATLTYTASNDRFAFNKELTVARVHGNLTGDVTGTVSDISNHSTTNLSEGTNLYFTNARADARIALQVGANLDLSSKDTDALSEGSTNLYFTNARADTRATLRITAADIGNLNNVDETGVANNKILKYNSTSSKWEVADEATPGIANLVEDTTPQLGGDLDVNGNNISFGDSEKAMFGNSNDLQIYHESTFNNSVIVESGGGNLLLGGSHIQLRNSGLSTILANFSTSADLYYNGTKKFETTNTGVTVTGSTTSETLISTIATGTAPLTVASTTMVSNLNADKLDDKEFTDIIAEATALAIALG